MGKKSQSKLLELVQRRRLAKTVSKRRTCPLEAQYQGLERSEDPVLKLRRYDAEYFDEFTVSTVDALAEHLNSRSICWSHCTGLHHSALVKEIGELAGIPPLICEDILHTSSRPRVDITEDHVFANVRLISREGSSKTNDAVNLQSCSFFLTKDHLFSFSEVPTISFDAIKERLRNPQTRTQFLSLDYLFWALLDAITHQNLSTISFLQDRLFQLDREVVKDVSTSSSGSLYNLQREASVIQRLTRPNRDIASALMHQATPLISPQMIPYLEDLRDYSMTTSEEAQSLGEFAAASREYLTSEVNQRLNNVMKILTIISTIFLPLSFLAGVYGMNFERMPELAFAWSYPIFWVIVLSLSGLFILYFKRKKWL